MVGMVTYVVSYGRAQGDSPLKEGQTYGLTCGLIGEMWHATTHGYNVTPWADEPLRRGMEHIMGHSIGRNNSRGTPYGKAY